LIHFYKRKMVKLVGILDDGDGGGPKACLARRQIPLEIEPDLTMIMALEESCLACGPGDQQHQHHEPKDEIFHRNYKSLSKTELSSSLCVSTSDVLRTLATTMSCVGCRRSVETLYTTLTNQCDTALEPLKVDSDGTVSVMRDHIVAEYTLANLLSGQITRLTHRMSEGQVQKLKKSNRGGRCGLHQPGTKRHISMTDWVDTWAGMSQECREAVVQLPYRDIRSTLDTYLKRHKFCTECSKMVNKAYNLLVEDIQDDDEKPSGCVMCCCSKSDPYCGISACIEDQHVHVKCDPSYINYLFTLAEPELNGAKQEKHAKNIELAKKEVLTCIGVALFDRFAKMQLKMQETEYTCDLLFLTLLKTLRTSLDMAADKKRGISDIELFCNNLEIEDKKKEGKVDKKKERKRAQRAKKRESKLAVLPEADVDARDIKQDIDKKERNYSGDSGVSSMDSQSDKQELQETQESKLPKKGLKQSHERKTVKQKQIRNTEEHSPTRLEQDIAYKPKLFLEELLEEDFNDADDEDDGFISEEDIRIFREHSVDILLQRQRLRENLKERFSLLCKRGVNCVNKRIDKPGCCYI